MENVYVYESFLWAWVSSKAFLNSGKKQKVIK